MSARSAPLSCLVVACALAALDGTAAAQSLYRNGEANQTSLIADNRAYRIGDIITIVVSERHRVEDDQEVKLAKTTSTSAEVNAVPEFAEDAVEDWFPLDWSSSRTHDGKAEVEKEGRFEANVTATVIDVLPNGNLVVEGKRKVAIDDEEKWMTVTGSVRAFDVDRDNRVPSSLVANATITYEGTGPYTRSSERGWFERLLDFVWPF